MASIVGWLVGDEVGGPVKLVGDSVPVVGWFVGSLVGVDVGDRDGSGKNPAYRYRQPVGKPPSFELPTINSRPLPERSTFA